MDTPLGVNCHYITEAWERKIFNLGCSPFDESHTAEHIYVKVCSLLEDWGLLAKTSLCLRDNAANVKAAFELEDSCLKSAGCVNHTIQLALKDGIFTLVSVENLLKKCRAIVSFANMSNRFYTVFYEKQELNDITDKRSLKTDCPTR